VSVASKRQRKKDAFKTFQRQLYHACLELVFGAIKPYMERPKVVRCPDGHFRRAVFSIGPYIADYPEQVWLAGVVQDWCPKYVQLVFSLTGLAHESSFPRCDAKRNSLDMSGSHCRCHEKTDILLRRFDAGTLWDEYGIRDDVVVCSISLW
jgi:hypothetical protein